MSEYPIVVMDYETALLDGTPALDYYRSDFRVLSAAFAWRDGSNNLITRYLVGEDSIRTMLDLWLVMGARLVVHNFQFEYGVTKARFPGYEVMVTYDTMRMTQVADNGGREAYYQIAEPMTYEAQLDAIDSGKDEQEETYSKGLSLTACISRHLLPEFHNHKEPYYAKVRERTDCKRGQEGKNLNSLTATELEYYNTDDAKVTLFLYEKLLADFVALNYDWRFDHSLYTGSAKDIADAKGQGVPVDREALAEYIPRIEAQIAAMNLAFRTKFLKPIEELETAAQEAWIMENKTAKGQERRRQTIKEEPEAFRFNVGSNKQLAMLFINKLGVTPKFWTSESKASKAKREANPDMAPFMPSPSFRAAHLASYGDGGELLIKRRKRVLVLTQAKSMFELSEHDGNWHMDLKACGTATGRFAGGRV